MTDAPSRLMLHARRDPRPILEDKIQEAIVQLMRFKGHGGLVFFHCPNGIPASERTGARFKRLGMRAGVSDLCLVLPDGRAAFLEVKSDRGRLSEEQQAFRIQCERLGIPYAVVRSSEEAEQILWDWGALKGPAPRSEAA